MERQLEPMNQDWQDYPELPQLVFQKPHGLISYNFHPDTGIVEHVVKN